jgi:hypothetical protein
LVTIFRKYPSEGAIVVSVGADLNILKVLGAGAVIEKLTLVADCVEIT